MTGIKSAKLGIHFTPEHVHCVAVDASGSYLFGQTTAKTGGSAPALDHALGVVLERLDAACIAALNLVLDGSIKDLGTEELSRVCIVRVMPSDRPAAQPLAAWPPRLASRVRGPVIHLGGGHDFRGDEMRELDEDRLRRFAAGCRNDVTTVAITAVGSTGNADHERRTADILREELGRELSVAVAHEQGGVGFLRRENTAILNAALMDGHRRQLDRLAEVVDRYCPRGLMHVAHRDGTVLSQPASQREPLMALGAQITHAAHGARRLSAKAQAHVAVCYADNVHVVMADGVDGHPEQEVTDDPVRLTAESPSIISTPWHELLYLRSSALHRTLAGSELPVIVCGPEADRLLAQADALGWAARIHNSDALTIDPSLFAALGAATSYASGTVERTVDFERQDREFLIAEIVSLARRRAILAGADVSCLKIDPVRITPLGYTPGQGARVRARAHGPLLIPSRNLS